MREVWKLMRRYPPDPRYWHRAVAFLFLQALQVPWGWLERRIHGKKLSRVEIPRDPIFVLGYWRSGTTYLQQLLCLDPGRATINTYQTLLPIGFLAHERILSPLIEALFRLFRVKNPAHGVPLTTDFPSEEDIAFCAGGNPCSPNWAHLFPKGAREILWRELYGGAARSGAIAAHRALVARLALAHPGKQLILKSPANLTRVRELLEAYPAARFIRIQRDQRAVFASNVKHWRASRKVWLQAIGPGEVASLIRESMERTEAIYQATRSLVPEGRLFEMTHEELCADPLGTLRRAHEALGLGMSAEYLARLRAFVAENHLKGIRTFVPAVAT